MTEDYTHHTRLCSCGHADTAHDLTERTTKTLPKGTRTACSVWIAKTGGLCGCHLFDHTHDRVTAHVTRVIPKQS